MWVCEIGLNLKQKFEVPRVNVSAIYGKVDGAHKERFKSSPRYCKRVLLRKWEDSGCGGRDILSRDAILKTWGDRTHKSSGSCPRNRNFPNDDIIGNNHTLCVNRGSGQRMTSLKPISGNLGLI